MRTYPRVQAHSRSIGLRLLPAAALVLACAVQARADTPGDSKAYTLFMGADVSVGTRSGVYPVWDVSGSSWVVKVHGEQVAVSTKDGPVDLKLTPGLKLTEISATIADLKDEPSFTPGNDPYTKFTKATSEAANNAAQSQFASNQANAMSAEASAVAQQVAATNPSGGPPTPGGYLGNTNSAASAQQTVNDAAQAVNAAAQVAGATPGLVVAAGANPDTESFDALDVSFKISSARTLEHPYIVVVGRYHENGAPQGSVRNWIYAKAIDRIDSKTRVVSFLAGGLTPRFQLKTFEVHLYNDGGEVATNLSSNRVALTRDEAFEYVKMEYVGTHKGATLPAAPAMGHLPSDLPARLAQGQLSQALYVRVSKDGIGGEAFLDEQCSHKVEDPYVESVVRDIRFNPALQNGQPVDGIAVLRLGQLML